PTPGRAARRALSPRRKRAGATIALPAKGGGDRPGPSFSGRSGLVGRLLVVVRAAGRLQVVLRMTGRVRLPLRGLGELRGVEELPAERVDRSGAVRDGDRSGLRV